jgi:hypothetical protein
MAFKRLIGSTRFWTVLVGLCFVVAVQVGGMPQDKANALSASIIALASVIIGAYTISPTPNTIPVEPASITITPKSGQERE